MAWRSGGSRRKDAKAARKTLDSIFGPETRVPRADDKSARGRAEKARRQEGVSRGTGGNPMFRNSSPWDSGKQKKDEARRDSRRPWWDKDSGSGNKPWWS